MRAYDQEERDPDYWDALYAVQEAELLVESDTMEELLEAAQDLDIYHSIRPRIRHLDLAVLDHRVSLSLIHI